MNNHFKTLKYNNVTTMNLFFFFFQFQISLMDTVVVSRRHVAPLLVVLLTAVLNKLCIQSNSKAVENCGKSGIPQVCKNLINAKSRECAMKCLSKVCYLAWTGPQITTEPLGPVWPLLPRDWNHRSGQLYQTWLQIVESIVAPLNIGLATTYHRAQNQQEWMALRGMATW